METIVNHARAVVIMIKEIIRMMYNGVAGFITKVNKLRKNNVAFGFKTLVKKPILNASIRVRSVPVFSSVIFSFDPFARIEHSPI